MLRHLHAFAWLRWRVLMNTLERTGRRDRLQRFSLASESLGPILLFLMMVPSALGLAVAGVVAGFALGRAFFLHITQFHQVWMAKEGIVVQHNFAVNGQQPPVAGDDQGVGWPGRPFARASF